jgi:sorbitol/mannitol transport system permease protein
LSAHPAGPSHESTTTVPNKAEREWNEFLFALNLTATKASTSPVHLVSFITSEGLLIAQLSAATLVVSIPVIIVGWVAQDKLVQGLSLGAVK